MTPTWKPLLGLAILSQLAQSYLLPAKTCPKAKDTIQPRHPTIARIALRLLAEIGYLWLIINASAAKEFLSLRFMGIMALGVSSRHCIEHVKPLRETLCASVAQLSGHQKSETEVQRLALQVTSVVFVLSIFNLGLGIWGALGWIQWLKPEATSLHFEPLLTFFHYV